MSYCLYLYIYISIYAHIFTSSYVYMYISFFLFLFSPPPFPYICGKENMLYSLYVLFPYIYTAIYHYLYFFLHFCPKISHKMGTALHFIYFLPYWNTSFPPLLPLKIALSLRDCRRRGFPSLFLAYIFFILHLFIYLP